MRTVGMSAQPRRLVPTRALIWTLFLYAGWYVLCTVVALGRAAYLRGRLYVPSQGDGYTDSINVWPGALQSVRDLLMYTALAGHIFAVPVAVLAIVRLADRRVWTRRSDWIQLLIGTALVVGTVVLALSPHGETVRGWVLD